MLKRDEVIKQLIQNGYDDSLATQLPKLFIEDFFDKEQEKLSEALDIFIDNVQIADCLPDKNNNVTFGKIERMKEKDFDGKSVDGIYYNFRHYIKEEFTNIVRRQPLQNVLLSGGAMKYHPELEEQTIRPVLFEKEIVGIPKKYSNLCVVYPYYGTTKDGSYIRLGDLFSLLESKGLPYEYILASDETIWFKHYDVMEIGTGNIKNIPYTYKKNNVIKK